MRFAIVFALLSLSAVSVSAATDERIADLYARGLRGEVQAVVVCISALEAHLATQPDDQLARVYLGSAWTLRSRDLGIGLAKLSALRKGIALMDEAVAAAPENAQVILQRAVTLEAFPVVLGHRAQARAEFERLVVLIEKNPNLLQPFDRELLYLNAGRAAQRAGEEKRATELWQRGLTIHAHAQLDAEIRSALAGS